MAVGVRILVVFSIRNIKEGGKSPCGRHCRKHTAGEGAASGGAPGPGAGGRRGVQKQWIYKLRKPPRPLHLAQRSKVCRACKQSLPLAQRKVSLCQDVIFCVQSVCTAWRGRGSGRERRKTLPKNSTQPTNRKKNPDQPNQPNKSHNNNPQTNKQTQTNNTSQPPNPTRRKTFSALKLLLVLKRSWTTISAGKAKARWGTGRMALCSSSSSSTAFQPQIRQERILLQDLDFVLSLAPHLKLKT